MDLNKLIEGDPERFRYAACWKFFRASDEWVDHIRTGACYASTGSQLHKDFDPSVTGVFFPLSRESSVTAEDFKLLSRLEMGGDTPANLIWSAIEKRSQVFIDAMFSGVYPLFEDLVQAQMKFTGNTRLQLKKFQTKYGLIMPPSHAGLCPKGEFISLSILHRSLSEKATVWSILDPAETFIDLMQEVWSNPLNLYPQLEYLRDSTFKWVGYLTFSSLTGNHCGLTAQKPLSSFLHALQYGFYDTGEKETFGDSANWNGASTKLGWRTIQGDFKVQGYGKVPLSPEWQKRKEAHGSLLDKAVAPLNDKSATRKQLKETIENIIHIVRQERKELCVE